jgi:hypothetical protein
MGAHRLVLLPAAILVLLLFAGGASAHNVIATTALSRFKVPKGATERREKIAIFGLLKGPDPVCYAGQTVLLYRREVTGPRLVARAVTDAGGQYTFVRRPGKDQVLYIQYEGFTEIVPTHIHTCAPSLSKDIELRMVPKARKRK